MKPILARRTSLPMGKHSTVERSWAQSWFWALSTLLVLLSTRSTSAQENLADWQARASAALSRIEGQIALTGLREPVEVLRDQWGVPHIYARSQRDLFFAQGFVVAQDRLFQIDLWRRVGLGATAELFGADALEADRFARLLRYRGDWDAEWTSYAPDTLAIATAFTDGINAFIDHCGDRLPIEFQILKTTPQRWRPEDVVGRMSGIVMVSNWQREVARARLIAQVGVEAARRLAPTDPLRDFALDPQLDPQTLTPAILSGYQAATRPLRFLPTQPGGSTSESNNWVVSGALSASGKPLLANDPHRAIMNPSLRYLVHLHAPGWNVIGAGEPGLPGVAVGHNERIAWGFTIIGTDQADLYVERTDPADSRRYQVGDGWQEMTVVREPVAVRGRTEPVEVELRYTRHGPVIHQDESKQLAFALKWAGAEPGGAAYLASLGVDRAQDWNAFKRALSAWKVPGLNFVYADVDGNIGWVAAAGTPIRPHADGLLPVPGKDATFEWAGFRTFEELPQVFNPPQHWVATANHNILPDGYPHAIAFDWASPHRFQRIQERLRAKDKFTLEDFQAIQHDSVSQPGQVLVRVLRAIKLPAELELYRARFCRWDGELSLDSTVGPLYAVWLQELNRTFFDTRIPPEVRSDRADLRSISVLLRQIEQPTADFFGADPVAARDTWLAQTFATAVSRTRQMLGDDPSQWRWGKLHTASFPHPLASLGPDYAKLFEVGPPVPRPGDVHCPNNTRHDDQFRQVHGASYRHVLDLADWDRGLATSVPGQSGQPGSPHYNDLLPLWAEGRYFPLAYSRGKVEAVTRHRLLLRPR